MITEKTQKQYIDKIRTSLTPLKAVRAKCIDCSGTELKGVRICAFVECPLYDLRMGRGSRATLKRIRAYCLWCCTGQRDEIKLCVVVKCPLWEYRFGKRPKKALFLPEILTTEGVLEAEGVNKGECIKPMPYLMEDALPQRKSVEMVAGKEHKRLACLKQVIRGR